MDSTDYANNTLSSEISDVDVGEDILEINMKVGALTKENEEFRKELRDLQHNKDFKISELEVECQKLRETNKSLDELVTTLKKAPDSQSRLENKKIISELESKVVMLQQSEQNLKRKKQEQGMEISNLKIEIEKLNIHQEQEAEKQKVTSNDFNEEMAEEAKNIINELLGEIEDLKKEKTEMGEKAINALTEKEMKNLNLSEEIEGMKSNYNLELHNLILQLEDSITKIEMFDLTNKKLEEELSNALSSNDKNQLKAKVLQEEFKALKDELEQKELKWECERDKINKEKNAFEHIHKRKILEKDEEIMLLRSELTKRTTQENSNNPESNISQDLENYKNSIKQLEEQNEKNELLFNEKINNHKQEIAECELSKEKSKVLIENLESDMSNLRSESERKSKENSDLQKQLLSKDGEIKNLNKKLEIGEKDKVNLLKQHEEYKNIAEKLRQEHKDLSEGVKQQKENYINDLKKIEEKYVSQEKKQEQDRKSLMEQIAVLKKSAKRDYEKIGSSAALSEVLEETEEDSYLTEINHLKGENSLLNNQISEMKLRINNLNKQVLETEILKKEVQNQKDSMKESKDMYEDQITELQNKILDTNSDLQKQKRRLTNTNVAIDQSIKEKLLTISEKKLTEDAEYKFLNDKVKILENEIEQLKELSEKDSQYFKDEVRAAELIAISAKVEVASLAFEKDNEILKYKKLAKRQALRIKNYKNGIFSNSSSKIMVQVDSSKEKRNSILS